MAGENSSYDILSQFAAFDDLPPIITDIKSFDFFKNDRFTNKLRLCRIRNELYIAISKYWYQTETGDWKPTKKHFFFPATQWGSFMQNNGAMKAAICAATKAISTGKQSDH